MSLWCQSRLVDIMREIDLSLMEEEFLEKDLERQQPVTEAPEKETARSKIKIAVISGLAASSLALTGVAVFLFRKRSLFGKAA